MSFMIVNLYSRVVFCNLDQDTCNCMQKDRGYHIGLQKVEH